MSKIKTPIKILVVVDMQNDFITGDLGTPEAIAIVPKVADYVKKCSEEGYKIFFTMDTHTKESYNERLEGKAVPPHCFALTDGWQIIPELQSWYKPREACDPGNAVHKYGFGCTSWYEVFNSYFDELAETDVGVYGLDSKDLQIELVGVCTDICVLANAIILRANNRDAEIIVHADMCAGTSVERHENALTAMQGQLITIDRGE